MEEPEDANPNLWNLLIVLTVIVAATVTFMVFDHRDRSHGAALHAKDSTDHNPVADHNADSAHTTETQTTLSETEVKKAPESREAPAVANQAAFVSTSSSSYGGEFVLIAASFRSESHAQNFVIDFREKVPSMSPEILSHSQDSENFFRIIASHSRSWKEISEAKITLVDAGYTDAWIYKHE